MKICFEEGDNSSWLLGDSDYPLQPWLLTPILDSIPESPEDRYTRRHCSARSCVERCIGVLKARFRCLLGERGLRYNPYNVGVIVIACAVLHNLCIQHRLPEDNLNLPNIENVRNENIVDQNYDNLAEGRRIRRNVVRRYFN